MLHHSGMVTETNVQLSGDDSDEAFLRTWLYLMLHVDQPHSTGWLKDHERQDFPLFGYLAFWTPLLNTELPGLYISPFIFVIIICAVSISAFSCGNTNTQIAEGVFQNGPLGRNLLVILSLFCIKCTFVLQ